MTRFPIAAIVLLVAGSPAAARAQAPPAERAASAIARGELPFARAIYDSVLAADPDDRGMRVARGHVLSWLGEHDAALSDFALALQADSADVSAWLGTGYASAWSRRWEDANRAFRQAAARVPGAAEPAKGLAYVALWRGDRSAAIKAFRDLTERYPNDAEVYAGLGLAQLADGRGRAARSAYGEALRLDSASSDARRGHEATRFLPAALEVTAWGGYTRFSDIPATDGRLGLRSAQLALQASPGARVWVGYDDGLALDNPALVVSGDHVPWVTGGGYVAWGGAFGTKIEGGWRDLGLGKQWTASLEQVAMLPSGVVIKVNAWRGFQSDDPVEWVAGAGVSVPASRRLRLELLGFTSGNGVAGGDGYRVLVSGTYRLPTGLELGGGVAAGRTPLDVVSTRSLVEGCATASVPIGAQRVLVQVRHQGVGQGPDFTALVLGLTLALWER